MRQSLADCTGGAEVEVATAVGCAKPGARHKTPVSTPVISILLKNIFGLLLIFPAKSSQEDNPLAALPLAQLPVKFALLWVAAAAPVSVSVTCAVEFVLMPFGVY